MLNLSCSHESSWWKPLARRSILWAMAMALMWGWFPFVFGGWIGAMVVFQGLFPAEPPYYGHALGSNFTVLTCFALLFAVSCLCAMFGAIAGAYSGYYAPTNEPENPYRSHFFYGVSSRTFWFWFASCLTMGAFLAKGFSFQLILSNFAVLSPVTFGGIALLFLGGLAGSFAFCLRNAIATELKAPRKVGLK